MEKTMRLSMVLICLLFLPVSSVSLRADEEAAPMDYTKQTANHRFLFVMLAPKSWGPSDLRRKYRKSGLYPLYGPHKPLWTVNWYSFDVILSSDGHHLIRLELSNREIPYDLSSKPSKKFPGEEDFIREMALAFYNNGKEIKRYSVGSLVKKPKGRPFLLLPSSVSHTYWMKASHFDDRHGILSVTTYGGIEGQTGLTYLFDVATGQRLAPHQSSAVK